MIDSMRVRVWLGLASVVFARAVTIGYNFVVIPVLLSAWGVNLYGEWVVLTAFAAIANLSNMGFIQASASDIVMRIAAGDHAEAKRSYSTTIFSLLLLVVVISVLGALGLLFIDANAVFGTKIMDPAAARLVVGISTFGVLMTFFIAAPSAAISAVAGAGPSVAITSIAKGVELTLISVLVWRGANPVEVACVPMFSALLSWVCLLLIVRRLTPWLRLSLKDFDKQTFRRLLHPSLAQFLLYASVNILAIQAPRIALEHLGGSALVTVFSVTLTYARTARILSSILAQTLQAELMRAFSEKKAALLEALLEGVCQANFWMTLFGTLVLIAAAPAIFEIWTHRKISVDMHILGILAMASVIGAYSESFLYFLTGINRVWTVALAHTLATLAGIVFAILAFPQLGVASFGIGLVLPELVTAVTGFMISKRILSASAFRMLVRSFALPISIMAIELRKVRSKLSRLRNAAGYADGRG